MVHIYLLTNATHSRYIYIFIEQSIQHIWTIANCMHSTLHLQVIMTLQQSSTRMWGHSQTQNDSSASLWQSPTVKWSKKIQRTFSLTSQHVLGRCYNKWPLTQLWLKLQLWTVTVSLAISDVPVPGNDPSHHICHQIWTTLNGVFHHYSTTLRHGQIINNACLKCEIWITPEA